MELDISKLKETLCTSLCKEVGLYPRQDNRIIVDTPFRFPDGDSLLILAEPISTGGLRLTDCGHTLMHLSYSMDVDDIAKPGNRNELFRRIIEEHGLSFESGQIFVDVTSDDIGRAVFRLGQALSQIFDISFLSRNRISSTFYEDLDQAIRKIAPEARIQKNYIVEHRDNAEDYPIDYRLDFPNGEHPLFLFGVPSNEKAKLATLVIQHWRTEGLQFISFIVFQDLLRIGRADVARLNNVGDESISSLGAIPDMRRKFERLYRYGEAVPAEA
jgi:hypothetical protein